MDMPSGQDNNPGLNQPATGLVNNPSNFQTGSVEPAVPTSNIVNSSVNPTTATTFVGLDQTNPVPPPPVNPAPPTPISNPEPPVYVNPPPSANFSTVPPTIPPVLKPKESRGKIKNVFLLGILLILLAGAIFGFTKVRSLLTGAEEEGCLPGNIEEQELSANSIIIKFTTKEACKMQVAYGVDEVLGLQMSEQIASTDHRIKLSPLMPATAYRYQIRSGDKKYEPSRGFLTLPPSGSATTPAVVVPTRVVAVTPAAGTKTPTPGKTTPAVTVTLAPTSTSTTSATPTSGTTYTYQDFLLHFGSSDPRFDTDKNGTVNVRDWQLYNQ